MNNDNKQLKVSSDQIFDLVEKYPEAIEGCWPEQKWENIAMILAYGEEFALELANRQKKRSFTFKEATDAVGKDTALMICGRKEEKGMEQLREEQKREEELYRMSAWCEEKDQPVVDQLHEEQQERVKKTKTELRKWQYKKNLLKGIKTPPEEFDIDAIKDVPIPRILETMNFHGIRTGNNRLKYSIRGNEKEPSVCVYERTNTFYDFGISFGGDNIALVQWILDCDFKQACQYLKEFM